ncbi:MAG: succinylglutamate desuccinylase/aspartoacylase family protein [Spirochaeta sp.]|jgi:aspartoacylase|nr:succinylglutamate desuccinylase/aspartoacylase family protein [Spirochaeta sp.]
MSTIRNVALCGGTHGNERSGVTVVQRRQAIEAREISPQSAQLADAAGPAPLYAGPGDPGTLPPARKPETFALTSLISNPHAVARNRRYIDFDLNRSFGNATLHNPHSSGYEAQRAQVLNRMLGPKGSAEPACDLIIDMHTTTARLGPTIIIRESDLVARYIAAAVVMELPDVKILSYLAEERVETASANASAAEEPAAGGAPGAADRPGDYPYLAEITPHGIEIEVGPVPQGVIRAETVIWTEQIVNSCVAAIDAWNRGRTLDLPESIEVYRFTEAVDYPRNNTGEIFGFVHPARQDRDFTVLRRGDPLFLRFDGSTVPYDGADERYPVFINEAAYYEKRAGMTLCEKKMIPVAAVNPISR